MVIAHRILGKAVFMYDSFKKRKEAWAFRQKYLIESRRILIAYLKAHRDEIYPA